MRFWQECIDSLTVQIESESVGTILGSNRLHSPHLVGVEYLDEPGFADGYIEMPAFPVEEDHVRNAGEIRLRKHRA